MFFLTDEERELAKAKAIKKELEKLQKMPKEKYNKLEFDKNKISFSLESLQPKQPYKPSPPIDPFPDNEQILAKDWNDMIKNFESIDKDITRNVNLWEELVPRLNLIYDLMLKFNTNTKWYRWKIKKVSYSNADGFKSYWDIVNDINEDGLSFKKFLTDYKDTLYFYFYEFEIDLGRKNEKLKVKNYVAYPQTKKDTLFLCGVGHSRTEQPSPRVLTYGLPIRVNSESPGGRQGGNITFLTQIFTSQANEWHDAEIPDDYKFILVRGSDPINAIHPDAFLEYYEAHLKYNVNSPFKDTWGTANEKEYAPLKEFLTKVNENETAELVLNAGDSQNKTPKIIAHFKTQGNSQARILEIGFMKYNDNFSDSIWKISFIGEVSLTELNNFGAIPSKFYNGLFLTKFKNQSIQLNINDDKIPYIECYQSFLFSLMTNVESYWLTGINKELECWEYQPRLDNNDKVSIKIKLDRNKVILNRGNNWVDSINILNYDELVFPRVNGDWASKSEMHSIVGGGWIQTRCTNNADADSNWYLEEARGDYITISAENASTVRIDLDMEKSEGKIGVATRDYNFGLFATDQPPFPLVVCGRIEVYNMPIDYHINQSFGNDLLEIHKENGKAYIRHQGNVPAQNGEINVYGYAGDLTYTTATIKIGAIKSTDTGACPVNDANLK